MYPISLSDITITIISVNPIISVKAFLKSYFAVFIAF